jgi:hypothetical protein
MNKKMYEIVNERKKLSNMPVSVEDFIRKGEKI